MAGACILPSAIDKLLRYSPYGDPSAGAVGFNLLWASLALMIIPAGTALGVFLARRIREYRAWMSTLTPQERLLVHFAEGAAMEAGHVALRDHNRREDARLSESVIGAERGADEQP
jgi:hypothetical protein